MRLLSLSVLTAAAVGAVAQQPWQQVVFGSDQRHSHDPNKWTVFNSTIKRVAVIGAGTSNPSKLNTSALIFVSSGPAGLQAAAALVEHNFTVRLYDRAPSPGGNWLYSEQVPYRESYPYVTPMLRS